MITSPCERKVSLECRDFGECRRHNQNNCRKTKRARRERSICFLLLEYDSDPAEASDGNAHFAVSRFPTLAANICNWPIAPVWTGQSMSALPEFSDVNFLCYSQRVADLNPKVADPALDLRMAEEYAISPSKKSRSRCEACNANGRAS